MPLGKKFYYLQTRLRYSEQMKWITSCWHASKFLLKNVKVSYDNNCLFCRTLSRSFCMLLSYYFKPKKHCNFIPLIPLLTPCLYIFQRYVILQLAILSDECCTSCAVRNFIVINMPSQIQGWSDCLNIFDLCIMFY